jgi:hypothetical protein
LTPQRLQSESARIAKNGERGMWWDEFVPKVIMEERLTRATQEFTRVLEHEATQNRLLQARLQEIEESGGWKFVLWSRKRFAQLFPPHSFRGKLNRLGRRAIHIWLERGTLSLLLAVVRKTYFGLGRRLLMPAATPAVAAAAPAVAAASSVVPAVASMTAAISPPEIRSTADNPPIRPQQQLCLYTSSQGNYFFHEMRDLLAAGLEELGQKVELRAETDGFGSADAWHIVLAPHEFFYLGCGQQLGQDALPGQLIVINTEQPSTKWFRLSAHYFPRASVIWDIDYLSAHRLKYRGWKCRHLPLGYAPDFRSFSKQKDLPNHYGTCFLEPHVRQRSRLVESLAVRPIDVVFFGNPTMKRQAFYASAAPLFAQYRCYFHFSDHTQPLLAGKTTPMNTATVMGLVQRSKILLNIHRDADEYFEWQRIVMQGLWHRTLVISEPCSPAPPFRPGIDFVEAALPEIADRVEYYLSDPLGRQEAQAIASEGHRTLTRDCRMRDVLTPLLAELGIEPAEAGPIVPAIRLAA